MAFGPDSVALRRRVRPAGEREGAAAGQTSAARARSAASAIAKIAERRPRRAVGRGPAEHRLYGGVEMLGAAAVAFPRGRLYEVAAGRIDGVAEALVGRAGRKLHTVTDVGEFNNDHPPPPQNGDAVPGAQPVRPGQPRQEALHQRRQLQPGARGRSADRRARILATFYPGPVTVGMAVAPTRRRSTLPSTATHPTCRAPGTSPPSRRRARCEGGHGLTTPIDMAFAKDGTQHVSSSTPRSSTSKHLRYVANTDRCSGSTRTGRSPRC